MQGETPDSARDVGGSIAPAWAKVDQWIDGFYSILPNLVLGMTFLILVAIAARIVKAAVRRFGLRRQRPDLANVLGALLQWTIAILGTLIAVTIIFPGVGVADLLGTLGIGSIAIGFAFKDILQNLLAGILILLRQPFRRGDQIVSGAFEGTVESVETRATIIRTYDGRQVVIPNSDIYTGGGVINTAHDSRRSEYDVGIGYGDDVGHAARVAVDAVKARRASCRTRPRRRSRSPSTIGREIAAMVVDGAGPRHGAAHAGQSAGGDQGRLPARGHRPAIPGHDPAVSRPDRGDRRRPAPPA